jgi:hypothetical protein
MQLGPMQLGPMQLGPMLPRAPPGPVGWPPGPGRVPVPVGSTVRRPRSGRADRSPARSAGADCRRTSAGADCRRPSAGADCRRPSAGADCRRPSAGADCRRPSAPAGSRPGTHANSDPPRRGRRGTCGTSPRPATRSGRKVNLHCSRMRSPRFCAQPPRWTPPQGYLVFGVPEAGQAHAEPAGSRRY